MIRPSRSPPLGKRVVVVGPGGNIGSHLVPHLGRMPGIGTVTLIDPDIYEPANLTSQDIGPRDVGKGKALVQAERLRRINPRLDVFPIAAAVESVPLGWLRGDLILTCLDSRRARQCVNQAAWRLGVPWIDAGVEGTANLARVGVCLPGADEPCLECAWDDRDYELLEQSYPCQDGSTPATATGASSSLGALAAALQSLESQELLSGKMKTEKSGRQTVLDAAHHKIYVTNFRRNPNCRMSDHSVWSIERLGRAAAEMTLAEALQLGPTNNEDEPRMLRVEGSPFITRLSCSECGHSKTRLYLEASLGSEKLQCKSCGRHMVAKGFDLLERLDASQLPESVLRRSLRSLGLRDGDVISVGGWAAESHYEVSESEK